MARKVSLVILYLQQFSSVLQGKLQCYVLYSLMIPALSIDINGGIWAILITSLI